MAGKRVHLLKGVLLILHPVAGLWKTAEGKIMTAKKIIARLVVQCGIAHKFLQDGRQPGNAPGSF